MNVCKCYRYEMNFLNEGGVCYGTKEREPCLCGGDESKCDFYPDKRQKQTNADKIRSMTDEELANWIHQTRHNQLEDRTMNEWLVWLK